MNRKILWFLIFSLIGLGIGYILTNVQSFHVSLCNLQEFFTYTRNVTCLHETERIGNELFFGMGALAIVFFVLLFVPRALSWWWKFAIWFVPLAAVIFITAPEPQGWVSPLPSPETVFKWVSGFYIVVSLVIIAVAAIRRKT